MKHSHRAVLRVEELESRLVPAGNVLASLSGQDLTLFGDHLANDIRMTQNAVGNVTITGLNGTTVNGLASITFANPQLIKTEVYMGNGNDRVAISGLPGVTVSNDLNIELGAGNDFLSVTNARIGANLAVKGDQGVDQVAGTNLRVGNDLHIDSGLDSGSVSLSGSAIGGALGIVGDAGNDIFTLNRLTVGGDINLEAKEGNDRITASSVAARSFSAITDLGIDSVRLTDISTLEDIKVEAGGGNDSISLTRVRAGKSVHVDAGDGNDSVTATSVWAAIDAAFIGGAGIDVLDNNGITAGNILEIKEFEFVV